jgi:(1->4)-alpha-D-glucan 1-alpha-D-glucosylmutase
MYDSALNVDGYAVEGFADADPTQLRLSDLLVHLPVAVLKATFNGSPGWGTVTSAPKHS